MRIFGNIVACILFPPIMACVLLWIMLAIAVFLLALWVEPYFAPRTPPLFKPYEETPRGAR